MANIPIEGKLKPLLQGDNVADAVDVEVDASGFDGNLGAGVVDVQLLAEAVDDLTIAATAPLQYAKVKRAADQTLNGGGASTPIVWDTEQANTDAGAFVLVSGGVRVLQAGRYRLRSSCSFFSSVDQRADPSVTLTRNGAAIGETTRQVYVRNSPGTPAADHQEASGYIELIADLNANDLIAVVAGGGTVDGGFAGTSLRFLDSYLTVESANGITGPQGTPGPAGDGSGNMLAPVTGTPQAGMLAAFGDPTGTTTEVTGIVLQSDGRIPRSAVEGFGALPENAGNPIVGPVRPQIIILALNVPYQNRRTYFEPPASQTIELQLSASTFIPDGTEFEFVNFGPGVVVLRLLGAVTLGGIYSATNPLTLRPGQALLFRDRGTDDYELIFLTPAGSTTPNPGASPGTFVLQPTPWDASAGSFPGASLEGFVYRVGVSGEVDSVLFRAHDLLLAIVDAASPTTFAGNWQRIDGDDTVHSWGGLQGVIDDPGISAKLLELGYRPVSLSASNFLGQVSEVDGLDIGGEVASGTRVEMVEVGSTLPAAPVDAATYGQATRYTSGATFPGQALILVPDSADPALTVVRFEEFEGSAVAIGLLESPVFTEIPAAAPAGFRFFAQQSQIPNFYPSLTTIRVLAATATAVFTLSDSVPVSPGQLSNGLITEPLLDGLVQTKLNRTDHLSVAHQAFVDSLSAHFGQAPSDQITVLIHEGGTPSHSLSDYYQAFNIFQQSGQVFYAAVEKPARVSSFETSQGSVAGTLEEGILDGYNVYRFVQPSYPGGEEFNVAFGFRGGEPVVQNVSIGGPTTMDGDRLNNQSVTASKLAPDIQLGLLTQAERAGLQALLTDLLGLDNASIIGTDPGLPLRFASLFEPDTPATTGSIASQVVNGDITISDQPAGGALRDDLSADTNGQLTGPGLEAGRFAIQGANGAIDIDTDGIVVLITYDLNLPDLTSRNFLFAIGDSTADTGTQEVAPCALVVNSDGLAWVGFRAGQEPTTRVVETRMYDGGSLEARLPGNEAESLDFTLPDPLSQGDAGNFPLTCVVTFDTYGNGSFLETRTETVTISARATTGPVQNVTLLPGGGNGQRAVTVQYIADGSSAAGSPHDVIRVELQADTAPWFGPDTHIYETRIRSVYRINETITHPATTFDIPIDAETQGERYTVALHLFRDGGDNGLNIRAAVNGHLGSSAPVLLDNTGWDASAIRFINPTLHFGSNGQAANTTGIALQRVLIARASAAPSAARVAQLSGQAALALYGLGHPIGARQELLASGIRWEGIVNGGATLPGTNAVQSIDISVADTSGRPALELTAEDIETGRYVVEFVVTDGANIFVVSAPGDLRAFGASGDAGRLTFALDDVTNPVGEQIVASANRVRFDSDMLQKQFGSATYVISIRQR